MMKLRALEPQDIEEIYEWENDPEIWQYSAMHIPFSRHFLTQYILSSTSGDIYSDKQMRLIYDVDGRAVGCIDLYDYDPHHHRAGIGVLVDKRYREKGYGKGMLSELLNYCHEELQLHMVYAYIAEDNVASLRLFESVGFVKSGMLLDWLYNTKTKKYSAAVVMQHIL